MRERRTSVSSSGHAPPVSHQSYTEFGRHLHRVRREIALWSLMMFHGNFSFLIFVVPCGMFNLHPRERGPEDGEPVVASREEDWAGEMRRREEGKEKKIHSTCFPFLRYIILGVPTFGKSFENSRVR